MISPERTPSRLVGNTAVQFISPALRIALGVVLIAALSRYLGVVGLGAYALVFAYVLIFAGVFNDVGLSTVCLREIAARPDRIPTILTSAAVVQLIAAAITYGLLGLSLWFVRYPVEVKLGIYLFGLTVFLSPLDLLVLPFQAQLRLAKLLGPALLGTVANFVLTILVIATHGSLALLVLAALGASVARYAWIARLAFGSRIPWALPSLATSRFLIREAIPLAIGSVIDALVQTAPVMALSAVSLSSVGLFNAASRIPQQLVVFPMALRQTTFPLLSASWINDRLRFAALARAAVGISVLTGVPTALFAIGFAGPIIRTLFGVDFQGAILPFQVLMGASAIVFPLVAFSEAVIAAGHQRLYLAVTIATFPLLIAGLAILGPSFGASGAAIALLAFYAALTVSTTIAARMRLGEAFPGRSVRDGAIGMLTGLTVLGLTAGRAPVLGALAGTFTGALLLALLQRATVLQLVASWHTRNNLSRF